MITCGRGNDYRWVWLEVGNDRVWVWLEVGNDHVWVWLEVGDDNMWAWRGMIRSGCDYRWGGGGEMMWLSYEVHIAGSNVCRLQCYQSNVCRLQCYQSNVCRLQCYQSNVTHSTLVWACKIVCGITTKA